MNLIVIDSGTTNSRVRLTDGNAVMATVSRPVGAKDVAITGSTAVLEQALRECIEQLLTESGTPLQDIEAIVASGMITSNMGLLEIPHLNAPAGLDDVASGIVSRVFANIVDRPILFIPGVKTGFTADGDLASKDMMRGEEAEIFGYLAHGSSAHDEPILFMHYGSHHKGILLENGKINNCATSITGELMMTIVQHTILKSSLLAPQDMEIHHDYVRQGLQVAQTMGFGRALFSSRVLQTMEREDKQRTSSFFLGVLLSLDLAMLAQWIREDTLRIVLYGKELFPSICQPILQQQYPHLEVDVIPEAQSDLLSAKGAVMIYEQYQCLSAQK